MKKKPDDRRVLRTQRLLKEALVALVLERGYEQVTIADVAERADVGRSTFYAHFKDKEELLLHGLDDLAGHLGEAQAAAHARKGGLADRALGFSLSLFEHAHAYRTFFQAVVGKQSGAAIQRKVRRILVKLVRKDLEALGAASDARLPRDAVIEFVVGSFVAVLAWWLERPGRLDAAGADALFRELTVPGVLAGLRPA